MPLPVAVTEDGSGDTGCVAQKLPSLEPQAAPWPRARYRIGGSRHWEYRTQRTTSFGACQSTRGALLTPAFRVGARLVFAKFVPVLGASRSSDC